MATIPSEAQVALAHVGAFNALASDKRLQILDWLKDPVKHFPPQVDGDLARDGVCSMFIADKLGVSAPTASVHLKLLTEAGLLVATRIKQWTFYQKNKKGIRALKSSISKSL